MRNDITRRSSFAAFLGGAAALVPNGTARAENIFDGTDQSAGRSDQVNQPDVIVASDATSLFNSRSRFTPGEILRTADGFLYRVADPSAKDHHLETAGGVGLYVLPIDGCLYAAAFGIVTGDWATDRSTDIIDSTSRMQAALNALKSRQTLILPSGTIYTRNLKLPYGKLSITIAGQGLYTPTTTIQFLNGANNGFELAHEAYNFENIGFRGPNTTSGSALFTCTRTDNLVDMDWTFSNCWFTNTTHIGKMLGRGLIIDNCIFGTCSGDLFILDYPSPERVVPRPSGYIGTLEGGFRGFTVRNSRFHQTQGHLFNVTGNNSSNARGFTITGNQADGYTRIIRGHANDLVFSGNNWYCGWNSADACMFDLITGNGIVITGNTISNSTQLRQVGNNPFIRATDNLKGVTVVGNTFVRRDVPMLDVQYPNKSGKTVRDVVIANNTYSDCFVTAPYFVRIHNATGTSGDGVRNITINESIYETPAGWLAVNGDDNWRDASIKVFSRRSDFKVHNIPGSYTRNNETRTGVYTGNEEQLDCFVGYPPKCVKIFRNDGNLATMRLENGASRQPSTLSFTATGFSVSRSTDVNKKGVVYYWEAF